MCIGTFTKNLPWIYLLITWLELVDIARVCPQKVWEGDKCVEGVGSLAAGGVVHTLGREGVLRVERELDTGHSGH